MNGTVTTTAACTSLTLLIEHWKQTNSTLDCKIEDVAKTILAALVFAAPIDYIVGDYLDPTLAAVLAVAGTVLVLEPKAIQAVSLPAATAAFITLINREVTLITGAGAILSFATMAIRTQKRRPSISEALFTYLKVIIVVSGTMSILTHLFED